MEEECLIPAGPYCHYFGPIKVGCPVGRVQHGTAPAWGNREPPHLFPSDLQNLTRPELEVLYQQARDGYYNGMPIMADSVYDELELRLRLLRSPVVRKYPRCSLLRSRPMYADAEEDFGQMSLLATVWGLLFLSGFSLVTAPLVLGGLEAVGPEHSLGLTPLMTVLGFVGGLPLLSTSFKALKRIQEGYVAALHGTCPNCGSEVYSFVQSDSVGDERKFVREATECHVCSTKLDFRAFILPKAPFEVRILPGLLACSESRQGGKPADRRESPHPSPSKLRLAASLSPQGPDSDTVLPQWSPLKGSLKRWAYGRIYARPSVNDLAPSDHEGHHHHHE